MEEKIRADRNVMGIVDRKEHTHHCKRPKSLPSRACLSRRGRVAKVFPTSAWFWKLKKVTLKTAVTERGGVRV